MAVVCKNRSHLLLGCGATALAVALSLAPQKVAAQAFQATPSVVQGNANIDRSTPGQDLIEVTTPTAVIDWRPIEDTSGNALDFLPTGNIASFYDAPNQGGFAVLNRILPATNGNVTVMNGTVLSSLQGPIAGSFSPGGFVAFYSPTGFLIGSSAVFDVGGLMLTTLDPDLASFDNFAAGAGSLNLIGQTGTTARITINPGADIFVTPENGFMIAAAAGVDVFGNVQVNGSHAYIAAEQVNLTINNGLFDIVIPVGTSVNNAMNINGNVGGPSSTGAGDNHMIYAVGQALANPIQMLFGGNLGFAPAASAGVVNGEIILSANYDVFGRDVNGGTISDGINAVFNGRTERSSGQADIFVSDANVSSSMLAISSHNTNVFTSNGPSVFDGNLLVSGRQDARVTVGNGQTFLVTGDMLVAATDAGEVGSSFNNPNAINAQGGTAFVDAFGNGTLSVNGDVRVRADAFAGADTIALAGGSAQAGSAFLGASGGDLNIAGTASLSAQALSVLIPGMISSGGVTGGNAHLQSNLGGAVNIGANLGVIATAIGPNLSGGTVFSGSDATGGFALVNVIQGPGSITIGGDVLVDASAFAGDGNGAGGGGTALAGGANINTNDIDALIDIGGTVNLFADAEGSRNLNGRGGTGTGGFAQLGTIQGSIVVDGVVQASGEGFGGDGIDGGNGIGGFAGVYSDRGSVTIGLAANVSTSGFGGNASFGSGGQGGIGEGGLAFLDAARTAVAPGSLTIQGNALVESLGIGGRGGDGAPAGPGGPAIAAGQGGEGRGGAFATVNARDPSFNNGAYALAQADYGTLSVTGQLVISSTGVGGQGGIGAPGELGGVGGNGRGGTTQAGLYVALGNGAVALGSASFGTVNASAGGFGGDGGLTDTGSTPTGLGGNGTGGFAAITSSYGAVTAGTAQFDAVGRGGTGSAGGTGEGGTAGFDLQNGGDVTVGDSQALAEGLGGSSTNGVAGNGIGGVALFNVGNGTLQVNGSLDLLASGLGGAGTGGVGGNGTGGSAGGSVNAGSATITGTVLQLADGTGGVSVDHSGGDGVGGRARASTFGGTLSIGSTFSTSAQGTGGDGTDGGDGTGGIAGAFAGTGSITIGGSVFAISRGFGGDAVFGFGGTGGTGTGGNAFTQANGTLTTNASVTISGAANILADGTGGRGGDSDGSTIAGGQGGAGIGGFIQTVNAADDGFNNGAYLLAQGDRGSVTVNGPVQVFSVGLGGQGGSGAGGLAGGAGGAGTGGTAQAGLFIGTGDGSVSAGQVRLGDALIRATGIGGGGGLDSTLGFATGNGGAGTGGGAFLTARLGTVQAGAVTVESDGTGGTGAVGGAGQGGSAALLTTNNGTGTLAQLVAYARGSGGAGQSGAGGTGTGGEAFIGFQGGTTNITGNATIVADGFGGQSIGANGANGLGGIADIATFSATAGNATIGGTAQLTANGIGGATLGTGFTGGTGQGGEAYLLTQVGGTLQAGAAQVAANGVGGSGPSAIGGAGTGGRAYIEARDAGSSITIQNTPNLFGAFSQSAVLVATGAGGDTTGGTGIGGTGTGGIIDILATTGGTINLPQTGGATDLVRLFSRGFGGGSSVDGGTGGVGIGGTGTIDVDGGTLTGGPLHLSMFAQGGSSLSTTLNINGGNAQGGQRFVVVQNGGTLTAAFPGGIAGGAGGNGSGTGVGGNGSGGLATFEVIGGTANVGSGSIMVAQNTGGNGATGGNASGGLATVLVDAGGVINILPDATGGAGTFFIGSNSFGGSGTSGAGGNATPQNATVLVNSGSINGGNLEIGANAIAGSSQSGTGGVATGGNASLIVNSGTISLAGVRVEADGVGGLSATGTHGNAVGGDALIQLTGATYATSGDTVVHSTGLTGLDPVNGTTGGTGGSAQGGSALMTLDSASQVTTGKIDLNSNADAFQAGSAAGGSSLLQLTRSSLNTTDLVLTAEASAIGGTTTEGGSAGIVLRGTGGASNLNVGTATMRTNADGASSNLAGEVLVDSVNSTAAFTNFNVVSLASNGGQAMQWTVTGGSMPISGSALIQVSGDINIAATDGAQIGGPNVASPTAAITLETPGTITITGNNDNAINFGGQSLSMSSSELNIENGARIGAVNMELTSLDENHTAILGGTTEEVGYTITQAEAERIEAGSITFFAPVVAGLGTNEPDVLIRDLTIVGSLDDGVSSVSLSTQGIVRVEGLLVYQDAASTDSLEIFAAERLEVVTPGGIGIVDSAGNPAGTLSLLAENLWVGDADLIGQLQADPDFAGRNDALKTAATGSEDPLGYLRGGSIEIGVGTSLFVRNTGTEETPGGILVGDGTLSIRAVSFVDSSTPPPIEVFAYGAKRNTDGTLVTGEAFYDLVNFNKAATASGRPGTGYVDGSMFNNCDINTGECERIGGGEEIIDMAPPVNNPAVVEAPTAAPEPVPQSEEEASAEFGVDFPGLVEVTAATEEGTFDDGVMSGGDSSLYAAADEDDEDEDEDEENDGEE